MDLNSAIHTAQCGGHLRDDLTMTPDWTVRWVADEKLLYYFDPAGNKRHKITFSNAQRASFQWKTVP